MVIRTGYKDGLEGVRDGKNELEGFLDGKDGIEGFRTGKDGFEGVRKNFIMECLGKPVIKCVLFLLRPSEEHREVDLWQVYVYIKTCLGFKQKKNPGSCTRGFTVSVH